MTSAIQNIKRKTHVTSLIILPFIIGACIIEKEDADENKVIEVADTSVRAESASGADIYFSGSDELSQSQLEEGRFDPSWKQVVDLDSLSAGSTPNPEQWEDIDPDAINNKGTHLPLHGDVAGPSVFAVQVLLSRSNFSPGILDGRYGKNTEKAVYWYQHQNSLPRTGQVDEQTFEALARSAGNPTTLVREHTLSEEDVSGPFLEIPEDIYEKAELDCMCYETLSEKLSEKFHTDPGVLLLLNDSTNLDSLQAGDRIWVPNVGSGASPATPAAPSGSGKVARIVVSDAGYYVQARDAQDNILYHFPATLGSAYSPSPSGDYRITNIAPDPTWHYQPELLEGVDDEDETAMIPPGPNNAVGVVWMALSKPHFGIHGTSAPETIGYTTSNGCVRLTNWDARFLSERIEPGVAVEFRDVDNAPEESAASTLSTSSTSTP